MEHTIRAVPSMSRVPSNDSCSESGPRVAGARVTLNRRIPPAVSVARVRATESIADPLLGVEMNRMTMTVAS